MNEPLYSIGTWDMAQQAYTPQIGLTKTFNIKHIELWQVIRELRGMHYAADRTRDPDGGHDNNDWMVLIERTDGKSEAEIVEGWKR